MESLVKILVLGSVVRAQIGGLFFGQDLFLDEQFTNFFPNPGSLPEFDAPCLLTDTTGTGIGTNGVVFEGACKHSIDCRLSAGSVRARGNCSLLSTCCIQQRGCGGTLRERVGYFQVTNAARLANLDRTCSLNVRRINSNIAQIRVDIIDMNIAPPVAPAAPPPATAFPGLYTCSNDVFRVRERTRVEIPDLCGSNRNNHFYIHLNPGQREVNLDVILASAERVTDLATTNWVIKITQLQSPVIRTKFDKFDLEKRGGGNQLARDFGTLAPDGCLQYFSEATGIVQSFGYVSNTQKTLSNGQNYVACFRNAGNCGVQFLTLDYNTRNTGGGVCEEVIDVPQLEPPLDPMMPMCFEPVGGDAMNPGSTFSSLHPGPVYFYFSNRVPVPEEAAMNGFGFQFRYSPAQCQVAA